MKIKEYHEARRVKAGRFQLKCHRGLRNTFNNEGGEPLGWVDLHTPCNGWPRETSSGNLLVGGARWRVVGGRGEGCPLKVELITCRRPGKQCLPSAGLLVQWELDWVGPAGNGGEGRGPLVVDGGLGRRGWPCRWASQRAISGGRIPRRRVPLYLAISCSCGYGSC